MRHWTTWPRDSRNSLIEIHCCRLAKRTLASSCRPVGRSSKVLGCVGGGSAMSWSRSSTPSSVCGYVSLVGRTWSLSSVGQSCGHPASMFSAHRPYGINFATVSARADLGIRAVHCRSCPISACVGACRPRLVAVPGAGRRARTDNPAEQDDPERHRNQVDPGRRVVSNEGQLWLFGDLPGA